MKTNFRKLRLMIALGVIKPEDYYHINVNAGEIILQGHYSYELEMQITKLFTRIQDGYDGHDGFLRYQGDNIKIILT